MLPFPLMDPFHRVPCSPIPGPVTSLVPLVPVQGHRTLLQSPVTTVPRASLTPVSRRTNTRGRSATDTSSWSTTSSWVGSSCSNSCTGTTGRTCSGATKSWSSSRCAGPTIYTHRGRVTSPKDTTHLRIYSVPPRGFFSPSLRVPWVQGKGGGGDQSTSSSSRSTSLVPVRTDGGDGQGPRGVVGVRVGTEDEVWMSPEKTQ